MQIFDFKITSKRGLHAQPIAALAAVACRCDSSVTFEYDKGSIDVSDAVAMMGAFLPCGTDITLKVSGSDEEETMTRLKDVIAKQLL